MNFTLEVKDVTKAASGKAIQATVYGVSKHVEDSHVPVRVWLPLSQVKLSAFQCGETVLDVADIPAWLLKEKGIEPIQDPRFIKTVYATPEQLTANQDPAYPIGATVLVSTVVCLRNVEFVGKITHSEKSSPYIGIDGQQHRKYEVLRIIAQPGATVAPSDEAKPALPGIYTLSFKDGERRTIRIQADGFTDGDGKQIISYLCGSDNNNDYKGFAHIHNGRLFVWRAYRGETSKRLVNSALALLAADRTKLHEYGVEFARASGRCYICNRTLTTPRAIDNGIGKICAGKTGVEW